MQSLSGKPLALALLLHSILLYVDAQTSNATCYETYDWMKNMHQQSPCTVTSFLLSPCTSTPSAAFIPPLNGNRSLYNFAGTSLDSTPCVCSTVTFAMLYACATCQGAEASILPWYIVSENCTSQYLASYPEDIPSGTSVPVWAYDEQISISGHLDIASAKQFAGYHEADATLSGYYGAVQPSSTGYTPQPDPEPYELAYEADSPSIGVVVGAVVGGSVGAILIVTLVILVVRRSRRRRQCMMSGPDVPPKGGRTSFEKTGGESAVKLYNPDDPTTYPGVAALSSGSTAVPQYSGLEKQDYAVPSWNIVNIDSNSQTRYQGASATSYAGRPEV